MGFSGVKKNRGNRPAGNQFPRSGGKKRDRRPPMDKAFRLGTPAGYLSYPPPEVQALRRKGEAENAAATLLPGDSLARLLSLKWLL